MKIFSPVIALILASTCFLATNKANAQAQNSALPAVTLSYGNGKTLAVRPEILPDHHDFEPVGVHPNQDLQINLQFASSMAGKTILVGVLEDVGGITSSDSGGLVLGKDGNASFGYRAPKNPGLYHVVFQIESQTRSLPFAVLTSSDAKKALRISKAD